LNPEPSPTAAALRRSPFPGKDCVAARSGARIARGESPDDGAACAPALPDGASIVHFGSACKPQGRLARVLPLTGIMMRLLGTVLFVFMVLAGASARGQSLPTEDEHPGVPVDPPAPGTGYRLQVIAADALSVGAVLAGFAIDNYAHTPRVPQVLAAAGLGGYALGGPIIHMQHRQSYRGAISLALRVGLPIVGAAVGAWSATCTPGEWFCGVSEGVAGFAIGAGAAMVIDSAFIVPSSDSATPEPAHAAAAARPSAVLRLAPRLVATPDVTMVGLGGSF
jgi:hypothetical protein